MCARVRACLRVCPPACPPACLSLPFHCPDLTELLPGTGHYHMSNTKALVPKTFSLTTPPVIVADYSSDASYTLLQHIRGPGDQYNHVQSSMQHGRMACVVPCRRANPVTWQGSPLSTDRVGWLCW